MKRALLTCLVGALVAILASSHAQPPAGGAKVKGERTFVVITGISKYADKQIKERPKAEIDARAIHKLLSDKKYLPGEQNSITLLVGAPAEGEQLATKKAFLDALRKVADEAEETDQVIIAFIGQGGPLGDTGDRRCYFLADSTLKDRNTNAVASEEIEAALKKLKSKRFCTLLDINFKGFEAATGPIAIQEPTLGKAPYREFLGDDGTDDHGSLPGRVAFLATSGLYQSIDLADHGLFAKVVVDGLSGKADEPGTGEKDYQPDGKEADGLVTVDELARYMGRRLPELARKNGKTEEEKEQDHFVLAGPQAHFVLTQNPAASAKRTERLANLEKALAINRTLAAHSEEARTLLERMPRLEKRQALRKAYEKLIDGGVTDDTVKAFETKRAAIFKEMELSDAASRAFAEKVLEAADLVRESYVRKVPSRDLVTWAVTELYSSLEEPIPAAIQTELNALKGPDARQEEDVLAAARKHLGKREDLDSNRDLTITLTRMLHKLDPHTTYFDPETVRRLKADIDGNFTGIGIQIRKDLNTDQLLVVSPIKGSPAYKAGLQAGDIITRIIRDVDSQGKTLAKDEDKSIPTKGLPLNKAVKLILGQADTEVTLEVTREGKEKPFQVSIMRGMVEVESVMGYKRKTDANWDFVIDQTNKIAYIRLTNFADNSFRDMALALRRLVGKNKDQIKGLVLDLRFNPGGLLPAAVQITDLFIEDRETIVTIRPRPDTGKEERIRSELEEHFLDFPMVVLINEGSASGSEIVAAALQDLRRAFIIGERSYGKGSVQRMRPFPVPDPEGGRVPLRAQIKLTTATFWRPSGRNLNKSPGSKEKDDWGVVPSDFGLEVKLTPKERRDVAEYHRRVEIIERPDKRDKDLKEPKDRQLEAALKYLRGKIKLSDRVRP